MRTGILMFLLVPILVMGACSTMDQAGAFAVRAVANESITPEQGGEFLLMTAASDMEATNRLVSTGLGWLDTVVEVLAGGGLGVAAVRFLRKGPLKSGSGADKAKA